MDIKNLKKVELHLHLDGSVRVNTLSDIMGIFQESAKNLLVASDKCNDLNDYLMKFDAPVKIMQTKENLTRIASELVEDLIKDNCIYAEVRFAPNKHTTFLKLDEVVDAVLSGLTENAIRVNLILCMMRGDSFLDNKKIVDLAFKYKNKGVAGIDLAGAEGIYKTEDYKELFEYARSIGVPFTIHAGEADGITSINSAIEFGATRIGHGIRAIEDLNTIKLIKEKDILLEVCPTSNIQTNICDSIKEHPINELYEYGINISINTDNRTVSNVSLNDEYEALAANFNYSKDDFDKMNITAIKHAFISEEEKEKLIKLIQE